MGLNLGETFYSTYSAENTSACILCNSIACHHKCSGDRKILPAVYARGIGCISCHQDGGRSTPLRTLVPQQSLTGKLCGCQDCAQQSQPIRRDQRELEEVVLVLDGLHGRGYLLFWKWFGLIFSKKFKCLFEHLLHSCGLFFVSNFACGAT